MSAKLKLEEAVDTAPEATAMASKLSTIESAVKNQNVTMDKVTRTAQGLQEALRQGSWTSALGPLGFVVLVLVVMAIIAFSSR